jgi:glycosyltransferase Alg8
MWTALTGPVFALMFAAQQGAVMLLYYFVWVGFTRWAMTLALLSARPEVNWRYPFLLVYGQLYGSLLKTYILFRLDRQSWNRQKTKLERGLSAPQKLAQDFSSIWMHATALAIFLSAAGVASGYFPLDLIYR